MSRILIVEDEAVIRSELRRALARAGHEVVEAGDVIEAERAGFSSFDLILSDLRLPGLDGDVLLERAGDVPVILMTAHGSVPSAVDAMKRGAVDYLMKPFDPDELLLIVQRLLDRAKPAAAEVELEAASEHAGMLGDSPVMRELRAKITKFSTSDGRVLIVGESGTGKELVARALHEQSPRAERPFVVVNCAAIPEGLIESELFGHARGAFTGAVTSAEGLVQAADTGTLFLDEVGELPLPTQARLLRLVQEQEIRRVGSSKTTRVDVRLLAATHRDLREMVASQAFREDLYFRLRVLELALPPLRERGEDVVILAEAFLERVGARLGKPQLRLSDAARGVLRSHRWPGNVRELENAIERAATLHERGEIEPEGFGLQLAGAGASAELGPGNLADPSLEGYFRSFVLANQDSMSETAIAKQLGISRKSLWERRQRYGIPRPRKSKKSK
ncbi:sigma-54-dependent Fis family transcriptional regulator [Pseudenhygromyxa sp. WMMC2535]|uniref:sigma-54-dependent transcriptional regulator n=1 Tax=Pseudenhygromyxa sp. WMMC2535 TaxID=2712867 RepID=UPI001554A64F|nr:sigma-54 dependent transcriptional regulator [Pseudenhygromyxa sp. WMMC2535]NVB40668.1 sigma-54-dependent Fis family transcriptional regulator [Pseudenhygromyxa sp. WMMC2535]